MLFAYVSLVCLCAEPSLLAMQNRFVMMNFDYVRLLSVEISFLMMNLSYRMLVIICFMLFAYVSLDSSSAQNKNKMQCANRTHAVQVVHECSTEFVE